MVLFRRIQLFIPRDNNRKFHFDLGISTCPSGCIIFSLGIFGVTWFRNECVRPKNDWFDNWRLSDDDMP
jgi:hypothetical protein